MKYLVLSADWNTFCLKDEFSDVFSVTDIGLSKKLMRELNQWNNDYQEIIPMGPSERRQSWDKILCLDQKGILLKSAIESGASTNCKVKYYSEGQLKYV